MKLAELQYLRNNGSEAFLAAQGAAFQDASGGLISVDSRTATQAELVRHRGAINAVWELPRMYRFAEQWAGLILKTFDDSDLRQTIAELSELPDREILGAEDQWLRAPLVSFVFSFLARGIAHDIIRPLPEFAATIPQWALLARHLPKLTAFDLVTAEAAALSATTADYRKASNV